MCVQKARACFLGTRFRNSSLKKPGAMAAQGTTTTTADEVARELKRSDEVKLTGQTPLGIAVMKNNLEMVKNDHTGCSRVRQRAGQVGNTAMHYAVFKGNEAIVAALCSVEGIDLEIETRPPSPPAPHSVYCE